MAKCAQWDLKRRFMTSRTEVRPSMLGLQLTEGLFLMQIYRHWILEGFPLSISNGRTWPYSSKRMQCSVIQHSSSARKYTLYGVTDTQSHHWQASLAVRNSPIYAKRCAAPMLNITKISAMVACLLAMLWLDQNLRVSAGFIHDLSRATSMIVKSPLHSPSMICAAAR